NSETVDHRGVRVGTDERVGVCDLFTALVGVGPNPDAMLQFDAAGILQLTGIPEPASAILVFLGASTFLRRRRIFD
ncbi:MAG: PEP-CTERM sorting domain-containing protein, partial [Verrucomicrobiota bacterium]